MKNNTPWRIATPILIAFTVVACSSAPEPEEEVTASESSAHICNTCDPEIGGVGIETVWVRGPSRWEMDNIRRWLDADRRGEARERHTSPVRDNPGPDATPKGLEAIPDPAYCQSPPGQMCPNPVEMLKECLDAARSRAKWAEFCGGIKRLFGSELSRVCYAAYLGNKTFRENWCKNAWGG